MLVVAACTQVVQKNLCSKETLLVKPSSGIVSPFFCSRDAKPAGLGSQQAVPVPTGVTRGGLEGAIAPSKHASPPPEGEKRFFRRFLPFIVP